ncbi:MAG: malto-oligosyltrehalose synthase [Acidimicrobiales bacterium]
MTPLATYRLQLHAGFGFDDVAALAPYLAELGVSHVYCSPYLQARPGSTHGYDVVDHRRLNEELGGEEGYRRMVTALSGSGLSHVVDIVPNHMAIAGRNNAWWWDVLENGPSSRWAAAFDIDWKSTDERISQRVLMPVLGDHYGRVLEAGDLRLEREGGSFTVRYFEHEAPISPRTLDDVLSAAADACGSDELASIAVALGRLPPATATDLPSVEERHRDKEVLRSRLERLLAEEPDLARAVDSQTAALNADPNALDELIQRQSYRLAYWRVAGRELDYRRFFDIPELVGLHMEDPRVFADTHELVLRLVKDGDVAGLRIDHPDGLRDPTGYFRRLREAVGPEAYVVAEKILEAEEPLPLSWAVAGTTGYDFLNRVVGLFVDPAGEVALTELYGRFTGEEVDFPTVAYEAKHLVMRHVLAADVIRLSTLMSEVCEHHRRYRDYTGHALYDAITEVAACFRVYRTYVVPGEPPSEADVAVVEQAVADAGKRRPDLGSDLLDFLRDVLLLRLTGDAEAEVAVRFQQLTAPVTAKGVEDTAFYRHVRLVALNDVGGDPGRFGTSPESFHAHNARMAETWPATMLSTSTHDTKRSEDVRVRIALLSEVPEQWALAVRRWSARNDRHRRGDGGQWPDRNTEYLLYQTLVGAWPIEVDRATAYAEKAVKEAKRHTSWITPAPDYEEAVRGFVADALGDEEFTTDLETFVRPLVAAGRVASLAQTLLKLTSPGVPDLYQGTELWDLSLVDPDNRTPVDFDARRDLLDKVRTAASGRTVLEAAHVGAPKLWLVQRALAARRRRASAFASGAAYRPLWTEGEKAHHAVSFLRGEDVVVVVPRLVIGLAGEWGDTALELPPGRWVDELAGTGRSWEGGIPVALADVLAGFPVALLGRT